jgi:hypothetical protein
MNESESEEVSDFDRHGPPPQCGGGPKGVILAFQ